MRISIHDVAREAKVSPATVSRILNGRGSFSEPTRKRVLIAARQLGYRVGAAEQRTSQDFRGTVGLLVPSLGNPFNGELTEGVHTQALALNYHVLAVSTGYDRRYQLDVMDDLYVQGIQGFLIASSAALDERALDEIEAKEYPVVILTKESSRKNISCVLNNDFRGALLATNHLLELGHTHIAAIMMSAHLGPLDRIRGYREAMRDAGLESHMRVVELEVETIQGGREAAQELIRADESLSGLVAFNDLVAVGVLQACDILKKDVPGDISIVGYDGTLLSEVTNPPLTTISQPIAEIGQAGMSLLYNLINGQVSVAQKVIMEPSLKIQGSTAKRRVFTL
ncbi:MAG: LacI family DNA-binding transcriptional regulator [Thermaerobacter sp.]|nr:LacI family DNA-binding transcriptional regulator [Thermaerobacter sp.]